MDVETSTERVAAEVRAEMARRRITQSDVGKSLGLSTAAVSRRLRGVVPFDVNELSTIAALLGVPAGTLLVDGQSEQVSA